MKIIKNIYLIFCLLCLSAPVLAGLQEHTYNVLNCVPHPLILKDAIATQGGITAAPSIPAAKWDESSGQLISCSSVSGAIYIKVGSATEAESHLTVGKFYYNVNGNDNNGSCGVSYSDANGYWTEQLIKPTPGKLYCDIINGNEVRYMCGNNPYVDGCPSTP